MIVTIFYNSKYLYWCDWTFLWFLACIGLQIFTYCYMVSHM